MSRWDRWSNSVTDKKGFGSFLKENNPSAAMGPAERAKQLGLQSNGKGGYIDPTTGQLVARTVNGELIFYDTNSPDGGAVSDSEGGRNLVQKQPSWADPLTGQMTTPPANAESPQEIAAIPDPTPATAPAGYNSFMQQKKDAAYQQNKETPQPARMTPDEAEEQEAQAQQGDPAQQQAFASESTKTYRMFEAEITGKDAAKKLAAVSLKQNQQQLKDTIKNNGLRDKAVSDGGYDEPSLVARSKGLKPPTGDLKTRAREIGTPQYTSRQQNLISRLDNLTSPSSLSKGAGSNTLSLDDITKFRKYIKDGPQNQREDVNDEDVDWAMDYLKSNAGKKWTGLQNRLKSKGDPAPSRKVVSRAREVVQSYLSNLGQSAIDGSSLPFSDSELDHGISLSNGGLDEGGNWRWLPKRYNQFKGDMDDDDLMLALDKEEEKQNSPDFNIKKQEDELTNMTRSDWKTRFDTKGWENMNVADIREKKGVQGMQFLKAMAMAAGVSYYKDRGKTRESGRAGGGTSLGVTELQDRLIDELGIPDTVDVNNFDKGLFDVLQKIEDGRSNLASAKKARSKEKRTKS
jgi:hypothetical protein